MWYVMVPSSPLSAGPKSIPGARPGQERQILELPWFTASFLDNLPVYGSSSRTPRLCVLCASAPGLTPWGGGGNMLSTAAQSLKARIPANMRRLDWRGCDFSKAESGCSPSSSTSRCRAFSQSPCHMQPAWAARETDEEHVWSSCGLPSTPCPLQESAGGGPEEEAEGLWSCRCKVHLPNTEGECPGT